MAILVGWAALRGYGRDQVPDNPTVDPLSYGTAVLTVLADDLGRSRGVGGVGVVARSSNRVTHVRLGRKCL